MTTTDGRIAELEARPDCEESLRERVARAIYVQYHEPFADGSDLWSRASNQEEWRRLADVAIAVITTPVEGAPATITTRVEGAPAAPDPAAAVARVEAVVAFMDQVAAGRKVLSVDSYRDIQRRLRAALAGDPS